MKIHANAKTCPDFIISSILPLGVPLQLRSGTSPRRVRKALWSRAIVSDPVTRLGQFLKG